MSVAERLRREKHFCASVGSVNLGALCVGLAIGWPKPSFAYVYEPAQASAPHSARLLVDESWVESTINAGASLGSLASVLISGCYGRRTSFALAGAILVGFWILLGCSGPDKVLIISAAAVAGLGVGVFSATTLLYVAEISTASSRGAAVMLFGCLGIFAINLLGYLFDTGVVLSLMAAPPLCFLASVRFLMIESPFYLFQKAEVATAASGSGDNELPNARKRRPQSEPFVQVLQAKLSLRCLRSRRSLLEIDEEYKAMEAFFNASLSKAASQRLLESLCPESLRPLSLIAAPVLCISQMLGSLALSGYAEQLIESISPHTGGLLTSSIDLLSTLLCAFAIERFGRRPLLILSIVGSGLCCLALALYHLTQHGQCFTQEISAEHKVLPTAMLGVYYGIYALGLMPILPIVTAEVFPCRAKTTAVGICTSLVYLVAFCVRRSYEALDQYTSSCFAFACFAMLGSIGLPFVAIVLPRTREQSLSQIQIELDNGVVVNY